MVPSNSDELVVFYGMVAQIKIQSGRLTDREYGTDRALLCYRVRHDYETDVRRSGSSS
jgi:hypothetical protein